MQSGRVIHTFEPIFDKNSRILILGTIPSVKSREEGFYYGNPRNRFWTVVSNLLRYPEPETIPHKKAMLADAGIALFDVLAACDIAGSADTSIKDPIPNDFSDIFHTADIRMVFANGKKAHALYCKLCLPKTGRECRVLPSTSPANAAMTLEMLEEGWTQILDYLGK